VDSAVLKPQAQDPGRCPDPPGNQFPEPLLSLIVFTRWVKTIKDKEFREQAPWWSLRRSLKILPVV
jgi:hypothetical protein